MDELNNINLPPDADDLSRHAPALFKLKGTETGFVVPALYFEELSELVIAKTAIPEDGGLVAPENYFEELPAIVAAKTAIPSEDGLLVPENYFEELPSIVEAKTIIPTQDGLVVPENYFEELPSIIEARTAIPSPGGLVVPEKYFEEFGTDLESHIALDNVKQDEGFVVPQNYFENLTEKVLASSSFGSTQDDTHINDDEVPNGYFDSLHDKVVARLENEGTIEKKEQRGRVIVLAQWRKYAAVTAVAASVALLIVFTWTFIGSEETGNGGLADVSNTKNLVPENYVRIKPEPVIDSTPMVQPNIPEGIVREIPKKPQPVKLPVNDEVIMNDDEIIAQSDLMDETLVIEFMAENNVIEETEEVLDPAMMEYLMNDNTSLDVFEPGDKKN